MNMDFHACSPCGESLVVSMRRKGEKGEEAVGKRYIARVLAIGQV